MRARTRAGIRAGISVYASLILGLNRASLLYLDYLVHC